MLGKILKHIEYLVLLMYTYNYSSPIFLKSFALPLRKSLKPNSSLAPFARYSVRHTYSMRCLFNPPVPSMRKPRLVKKSCSANKVLFVFFLKILIWLMMHLHIKNFWKRPKSMIQMKVSHYSTPLLFFSFT